MNKDGEEISRNSWLGARAKGAKETKDGMRHLDYQNLPKMTPPARIVG